LSLPFAVENAQAASAVGLGAQIKLSPAELAGIIAFLAAPEEQKLFKKSDIPAKILKDMDNM